MKKLLLILSTMLQLAGLAWGEEHGTTLTLVTYNLHIGVPQGHEIGVYRSNLEDVRRQADVLTTCSADLIALQEVDSEFGFTLPPARRRSSLLPVPRVLAALTGLTYMFGSAQDDLRYPSDNAGYVEWGTEERWTNNGARHGEVGNALLTRLELTTAPENLSLPRREGKERRACLRAELAPPAGFPAPIVVYATHLQHDSAEARSEQMEAILERAKRDVAAGALVFLLGDLNDAEKSTRGGQNETAEVDRAASPRRLAEKAGFHDLHASFARMQGRAPEPTFPADVPNRRLDYIYASRDLPVLDARVLSTLASDHLPVVVTVQLASP